VCGLPTLTDNTIVIEVIEEPLTFLMNDMLKEKSQKNNLKRCKKNWKDKTNDLEL
jgi:hypothetical protein